jgi:cytochrome b561
MRYDRVTKLLHIGIALAVLTQLACSEFMRHPHPHPKHVRTALEAGMYEVHEWVGIAAFALVVLRIIWGFVGPEKRSWARLFPWFSSDGRAEMARQLREEVPGWFMGRISDDPNSALAGSIHGLGLLTVLGMASTGLFIFLTMGEDGTVDSLTHTVMEIHADVLGNLIWAYVIGHVGMAMIHKLLGHDLVREMFTLKG